ncbi:MAG: hypothetical protein AB7R69_00750 [Candidatus Babeliales bacterium]
MNKKMILYCTLTCSLLQANSHEPIHSHENPPITVSAIIDGTPFGINGYEIKKMIYMIREVEKLVYGVLDPHTKIRKGKYLFGDRIHCIATLAEFEQEQYPFLSASEKKEFKALLHSVIEDFIHISMPFVEQARGVKSVTLGFIKEWSEKHEREESPLLYWAREKDGHEFDTFRQKTTSFEHLHVFCQDLVSFMSDLIQSCPRGWQQFLDLQKKAKK